MCVCVFLSFKFIWFVCVPVLWQIFHNQFDTMLLAPQRFLSFRDSAIDKVIWLINVYDTFAFGFEYDLL